MSGMIKTVTSKAQLLYWIYPGAVCGKLQYKNKDTLKEIKWVSTAVFSS
jgi:hypothetical protein